MYETNQLINVLITVGLAIGIAAAGGFIIGWINNKLKSSKDEK